MEGYKKKLCLYNIHNINVAAVVVFVVTFLVGFLISALAVKAPFVVTGHVAGDAGLAVGLVIVGVVLHEGLHALGAIMFGKARKDDIKFGAKWKEGVFYCHVDKPIPLKAYRGMLILPLAVTLVAFALVVAFGGTCLLVALSLLVAGASGDVAMFVGSWKEKDKNRLVLDHPDTTAYYLLYTEDEDADVLSEEEEKEIIEKQKKEGGAKMGVKIALIALFIALFALALFVVALIMKFI